MVSSVKIVKKHPLDGYEKSALVSIETATASLSSLIPSVAQMVWVVQQNCGTPSDKLTSSESAAIMLYTMIWSEEENFSASLNQTLMSNNYPIIEQWYPYLKLLLHALSKLPNLVRVVYRGAKKNLSSHYTRDQIVDDWQFSLCTSSIKDLEKDETFGKSGERTLFTIECQTGKDVSQYSFDPNKELILIPPGRRWKVLSCLDAGDQMHIIQLREIEALLKL